MFKKYVVQCLLILTVLIFQGCKNAAKTATDAKTTTATSVVLDMKAPALIETNQCVPVILSVKNGNGDQIVAPSNLSINISGTFTTIYTSSTCLTSQALTVNLAKNNLSKIIYVKPTTSQDYIFELQDLTGVANPQSFILSAKTASGAAAETYKLAMSGSTSIDTNTCKAYVVTYQNSAGVGQNRATDLLLTLSGAGTGGSYYAGTNCAGAPVATQTILTGTSFISFSYKNTAAENIYLVADAPVGSGIQSVFYGVQVAAPVVGANLKLAVSGPTAIEAGQCRSFVVSLQNSSSSNQAATSATALTFGGAGTGGTFYSGTNCAGALTTPTIASGSSFLGFSYKNTTAENVNLTIDSPPGSGITSAFYGVQVNPISASVPTQLVLSGPSSVSEAVCSGPIVVRSVDATLNSAATTSAITVAISGVSSIWSDASCSSGLGSPIIAIGTSATSFYFKQNVAGNIVIGANDGGPLTDGSLSVQVTGASGTSPVKYTVTGPSSVKVSQCSAAFVVKTTNGSGTETAVLSNTTATLTGKGSGDFYADAACAGAPISTLLFGTGTSNKSFYYKGTAVSNLTFTIDGGGLTPISTDLSATADVPTKLILTGQTPITLGECRAYTVTSKDTNNFTSSVAGSTAINLTGAGSGAFYSDSSCVNSTSSVIINPGQSSSIFYYKTLSAGTPTLSADNSGGLTAGTLAITVDQLAYSKVIFSRPTLVATACTAVTVTLKDTLNNATNAGVGGVNLALTSTGSATYSSASNCVAGVITTATITNGTSSTTIYVKDNVAESVTLGVTSTGLTSDSWTSNVTAGSNSALQLTGLATAPVGDCTAYDLKLVDSLGNLSPATSSTSVNFSGLSNARFYSDVNCTTLSSSATLSSGTSSIIIYLKGNVAESLTIGASSGLLTAASKAVSLIAGTSNKLVINGASTVSAGACTTLTAQIQDSLNNPITQTVAQTVTMSGNGGGSYYSDSGCTVVASTVSVGIGSSSGTIYIKSNIPASLTLVAQASGLFDGSKNFAINPLAPTKLVLTGSASITTGVCTAYSVSLQDTLNNLSSAGNAKTLNFSGAGSGAFYSDSSCALPAASIALTNSQTSAQIYYKGSAAQTANLNVDDTGLPDLTTSTFPVTVASSGGTTAIALKISGSTSINTNTCVPYAVMTTDTSGIAYNVSSNLIVTMAGGGTGTFYSNSNCSSSSTTVTITTGSSLAYIYYSSASAQNLVYSATASGASATTLPVAVVSGASSASVSRLTLSGTSSILTNACIPYVISSADSNGNSMNTIASTSITLSGKGTGDFYTEDTCTTTAAGAATIGAGTSYTTVYYKNTGVQNLIFIAQSTGLSNGTMAVGVSSTSTGANFGPAVKLALVAQPSSIASVSEAFGNQPIVAVYDSLNNVVSTASNTITLSVYTDSSCTMSAGSVIAATANPLNASGGVANFAGVNITAAQVVYIKAAATGLASACSGAIQVYPSTAAKLAFSTQPSSTAVAGTNLAIQPQISILNYTNTVVTTATNAVTIAAYTDSACTIPATGTLDVSVNNLVPASGVAAFSNIDYTLASTIYLRASATGLTSACSSGITVSAATPTRTTISTQPTTSGKITDNFSLVARLYDVYGNISPVTHSMVLTAYPTANCTGTPVGINGGTTVTIASALGTVTYPTIGVTAAGTISLGVSDATLPAVTAACSNAITLDGGTASKIAFTYIPSTVRTYSNFSSAPLIQVQDSSSNLVKTATNTITALAAYTDSGCTSAAAGTLSYTSSLSQGVNSITSFSYSTTGTIYLKATSSLGTACSTAVVVTNGSAKIATGGNTTCAVINGGVWCWGSNSSGTNLNNRFGDGMNGTTTTNTPIQVAGVGGVGYLTNIIDVAVSPQITTDVGHACALSSTGSVYCWGGNNSGQLGDGTAISKPYPVQVLAGTSNNGTVTAAGYLSSITAISTGYAHTCAVSSAGAAYCWGANNTYQLGDSYTTNRTSPVQVATVGTAASTALPTYLSGVTAISAGGDATTTSHTCAAVSGGVNCWGYNGNYQLGDTTVTVRPTPIVTSILTGITAISAGNQHTCAINSTTTYCWGLGTSGQLGDNSGATKTSPIIVVTTAGTGSLGAMQSISAGVNYTCSVSTTGISYCWGANATYGMLGDSTTTQRNLPVRVVDVGSVINTTPFLTTNIISISAGLYNTCAVANDGAMYCWGLNTSGQLGDQYASTTNKFSPIRVKNIVSSMFSSVSVGHYSVCGLVRDRVYCWGVGTTGELGDGQLTTRNAPTLIPTLSGVKDVQMGYQHGCALLKTGKVWCWGLNSSGQLGDSTTTNRTTPVQVFGPSGGYLSDIVSITAGYAHSCAVTSTGSAYCWGYNANYQLGDSTTVNKYIPVQVAAPGTAANTVPPAAYFTGVTSINAGFYHTCAVTSAGAAYCWGGNANYQIGDNANSVRYAPTLVAGLNSGVTAISAGYLSSCAIKSGAGYCWGTYTTSSAGTVSGYLSPSPYTSPAIVSGWTSGVTSINAGNETAMAVVNGKVRGYGNNPYNTAANNDTLKDIIQISLSSKFYNYPTHCALRSNGVVYCWGGAGNTYFNSAQAGNGTTYPSPILPPVIPQDQYAALAVGETHSCGIFNGSANCWGSNTTGALGAGVTTSTTIVPVLLASNSSKLYGQTSIGAGGSHSCSLSSAGEVYCWGDNTNGKLGNNSSVSTDKAVQVLGVGGTGYLNQMYSLAVGYRHTCAVAPGSQQVNCWGYNANGQLGNNTLTSQAMPVQVKGVGGTGFLSGATQVVAGRFHTCALIAGQVYCWGSNSNGQLGANIADTYKLTPVQVVSSTGLGILDNVTYITAGANHTCAISNGATFCWGSNSDKQLGNDTYTDSSYPVGVLNSGYVNLTGVISLTAGLKNSCAISSIGEALCWGSGALGQNGSNSSMDQGVAQNAVGIAGTGTLSVSAMAVGSSASHNCGISMDATTAYCWGQGTSGQIGNGASATVAYATTVTPPTLADLHQTAGTASQSAYIITGVGTSFTASMIGSQFIFANGVSAGIVVGYTSATSITVTVTQTVTSQAYTTTQPQSFLIVR